MSVHSNITPKGLQLLLQQDKVFLVDVREASEFQREHVAQAKLYPKSSFDAEAVLKDAGKDATICVMCASGGRSAACCDAIRTAINAKPSYSNVQLLNLNGGMSAWRMEKLPVVENTKAPLPIIRQVHLIASTLIMSGSLLGYFVNKKFFALPFFVGCGLFVSGSTGFCGMALLLQYLPYNKVE